VEKKDMRTQGIATMQEARVLLAPQAESGSGRMEMTYERYEMLWTGVYER